MAKQGARIAVLAGGRGSRLGGSKPSVPLGGRPLIDHVLAAAAATGLPVVVVAKRATPLPKLDAEVLFEPDRPTHPLAGVLAALRGAAGAEEQSLGDVIAVGCDTPFVTAQLLLRLAARSGAAAFELDGALQPLPVRYPRSALAALEQGVAAERPLRAILAALRPELLTEGELRSLGDPRRLLFNVNDEDDLREAERLLKTTAPTPAPPPLRAPAD